MIKKFNNCILKIIVLYVGIPALIALFLYNFLPIILNYPPDSIDNAFQQEYDGITYTGQYILLISIVLICSLIVLFVRAYRMHTQFKKLEGKNTSQTDTIDILLKIRRFCYDTPYLLYVLEILLPLILLPITFVIIKAYSLTIFKICLIYISLFTLASVISFVFAKNEFGYILTVLNDEYPDIMQEIEVQASAERSKVKALTVKLIIQFMPLVVISLIFISLVGYVQATKETGDVYYLAYKERFSDLFENGVIYNSTEEVWNKLTEISLLDNSQKYFIINSDGSYLTNNDNNLEQIQYSNKSDKDSSIRPFFIKYVLEKSRTEDGRAYDYYCLDTEGIAVKCNLANGDFCYAGINYDTTQLSFLKIVLISDIVLFILIFAILYYVTKSLSEEIKTIASKLKDIASSNENNINLNKKLIVTSEDELADLSIAFNQTQGFTKNNINQLRDNQSRLMESERLASLGQLIGGIAHNLKTPIMSISGAAEGLTDLIKEYDSSIDDPEVNSQDHHDIAKDMETWVSKIKEYTSYMSDVITAVKGQAVTLSETEKMTFDVEELIKRVNILMKHELKSALINLNISMKSYEHIQLHGDVNSLVQVINNLISNSIQAYNGKTNENIDLIVENDNKNLYISVKDYGCGLSEEVKKKLFKEMITTKGKNGTGLGLYMSYSTIKAHFGGDIKFESEAGKGTTFTIILPLN